MSTTAKFRACVRLPVFAATLKFFVNTFGRQKLKAITYEHLRTYRNERLSTGTHQSKQRSLATVNREMAYLRRILNIAERNGWVTKNPFLKAVFLRHLLETFPA